MADVRSKLGAPILDDFNSSSGTPIVVNQTTGGISVLKSDNTIQEMALVGGSASQTFSVAPATAGTHAPEANQMIGRNLIVNGSCQVDQINNGAIITAAPSNSYPADNVRFGSTNAGKFSLQQVTNSLRSLGATHAVRITTTTQVAPSASEGNVIDWRAEGLDTAVLQWGTANAMPVSLQFKARAHVAGTYSGSIGSMTTQNYYIFTFALSADTDTLVKIENIPGATAGTWLETAAGSLQVLFDLGSGTDHEDTAGAWTTGTNKYRAPGSVILINQPITTSTLDISDVKLEKGPFCTAFERKLYSEVLRECQRYYWKSSQHLGYIYSATVPFAPVVKYPVPMRSTPTLDAGAAFTVQSGSAGVVGFLTAAFAPTNNESTGFQNTSSNWTAGVGVSVSFALNARL